MEGSNEIAKINGNWGSIFKQIESERLVSSGTAHASRDAVFRASELHCLPLRQPPWRSWLIPIGRLWLYSLSIVLGPREPVVMVSLRQDVHCLPFPPHPPNEFFSPGSRCAGPGWLVPIPPLSCRSHVSLKSCMPSCSCPLRASKYSR